MVVLQSDMGLWHVDARLPPGNAAAKSLGRQSAPLKFVVCCNWTLLGKWVKSRTGTVAPGWPITSMLVRELGGRRGRAVGDAGGTAQ